jgi:hypothetical protein
MKTQLSNIPFKVKQEIMFLGGTVDESSHEKDFVRVWFDKELMTACKNGDLWTLTFKGETTTSPTDELPIAVRFLLNYTIEYNVVD